ncbi:hypothetical protein GOBAR_DD36950 [Gossypium barbadense]|nr:hypothetical protein GOBAR_DD36950 [Gossypium barbadense]
MHALFSEKVAVPSLEKLNIWDLNVKMIFYNDLAPAKDLPQLELLCIRGCRVEEIVSKGDGVEEQPVRFEFPQVSFLEVRWVAKLKCFYEGQHTIVWPMLKKLETDSSALLKIVAWEHLRLIQGNEEPVLLGEESLTSFCPRYYSFEFPCLEELVVEDCPKLKIFSEGVLSTPQLQRIKQSSYREKWSWTSDLNTTIKQLYTEKFQERVVMQAKTWLAKGASMITLQLFSAIR